MVCCFFIITREVVCTFNAWIELIESANIFVNLLMRILLLMNKINKVRMNYSL